MSQKIPIFFLFKFWYKATWPGISRMLAISPLCLSPFSEKSPKRNRWSCVPCTGHEICGNRLSLFIHVRTWTTETKVLTIKRQTKRRWGRWSRKNVRHLFFRLSSFRIKKIHTRSTLDRKIAGQRRHFPACKYVIVRAITVDLECEKEDSGLVCYVCACVRVCVNTSTRVPL